MKSQDLKEKLKRFRDALDQFLDRLREDRYVLAAVLIGSLNEDTIWHKDGIGLWVIETDGVTKRLRYDGEDERVFRTFAEEGILIHAEIIPRSRFRRMIEGSSRTAFRCNFFAVRELVYCEDPSIESWFDQANSLATTDQERELLAVTTWVIHAHRHTEQVFQVKGDIQLTVQGILWAAHSLAHLEIVRHGEIYEEEAIYKAIEYEPELFQTIYLDVISKRKTKKLLANALEVIDQYLNDHADAHLAPLLHFLKKEARVVPLSEIADHFAYSQLYPWHLESACEWLERKGRLEKVSAPFAITKKSRVEVEEPAYFLED